MLVLLALAAALAGTQTVRGNKAALLIIDVQDCFLPGGSMAVTESDQVRRPSVLFVCLFVSLLNV